MSRRIIRVEYHLDSKGIKELPYEEIAAILRGADPLMDIIQLFQSKMYWQKLIG